MIDRVTNWLDPIDLLQLPYSYDAGDHLLKPHEFTTEFKRLTGKFLDHRKLPMMAEDGLLLPWYVEVDAGSARMPSQLTILAPSSDSAARVRYLFRGGAVVGGQDATQEELGAAFDFKVSADTRPQVWYSQWQLLMVSHLKVIAQEAWAYRDGRLVVSTENLTEHFKNGMRERTQENWRLSYVLTAVGPLVVSWLKGVGTHHGNRHDELEELIRNDDLPDWVQRACSDAGVDLQWMYSQARALFEDARAGDGWFHRFPLLRMGRPGEWKQLRLEPRVLHRMRMAGECLLAYCERSHATRGTLSLDHLDRGQVPPIAAVRLLPPAAESRAAVAMEQDMSERPLVLLAVEGDTEFIHAQALLKKWKVPDHVIDVVNMGGVSQNMQPLVNYMLRFTESDRKSDVAGRRYLAHAVTRVIVCTDPEEKWSTDRAEKSLKALMSGVRNTAILRGASRSAAEDLAKLVEHEPWSHQDGIYYELAAFSDEELATALIQVHDRRKAPANRLSRVLNELAKHRQDISNYPTLWKDVAREDRLPWPSLKDVTMAVWGQNEKKRELADVLVPLVLNQGVESRIGEVIDFAYDRAHLNPRGIVGAGGSAEDPDE